MSKSLRNAVDPIRLAKELGADVLRYHLLRAVAFGQDGDFDHAALLERYNADLGKNLGNLLARTLGLCVKMSGSKTPALGEIGPLEKELVQTIGASIDSARAAWLETAPHRALEATWAISSAANQYVDKAAPWAAAKAGDTGRVATILATLLEALRVVSVMIWPAMPTKSDALRAQLGLAPLVTKVGDDLWPVKFAPRPAGEALAPSTPLFPTLDEDQRKALLDRLVPKPEPQEPSIEEAAPATSGVPTTRLTAEAAVEAPTTSQSINYDQFAAVELKVGVVVTCVKVPKKDKLLQLSVDVGEESPRTIIAGLALSFTPETLVGRRVVVVANLQPRDFGKGLVSHGMLLATGPSEALHLATVDGDVPPGARLK
jgi:methionyl-tRNA synthetase